MAFKQQVSIPGDATYQISQDIKKYTLGDLGFITNNAGAYVLHRSLEPEKALANAIPAIVEALCIFSRECLSFS